MLLHIVADGLQVRLDEVAASIAAITLERDEARRTHHLAADVGRLRAPPDLDRLQKRVEVPVAEWIPDVAVVEAAGPSGLEVSGLR